MWRTLSQNRRDDTDVYICMLCIQGSKLSRTDYTLRVYTYMIYIYLSRCIYVAKIVTNRRDDRDVYICICVSNGSKLSRTDSTLRVYIYIKHL